MITEHFEQIKYAYDMFYKSLLKKGKLPLKDTKIGYWAISTADDIWKLFNKIKLHEFKNFIDIGSGDGKVALIASLFTNSTGIEYDPWLVSMTKDVKSKLTHIPHVNRTEIIKGDFMSHDLSTYDVVFWNADKKNQELNNKFKKELRGELIVHGPFNHPEGLTKKEIHNINGTYMTSFVNLPLQNR